MAFAVVLENRRRNYRDAHLELNFSRRSVRLDSRDIALAPKEFDLLALLVQRAGDIVLGESLLETVWGCSWDPTRLLADHVFRLRRKLGPYGWQYIENFFGVGYRFRPIRATKHKETGRRVYIGGR
jgi:DNA-binding response OmpR family regulator